MDNIYKVLIVAALVISVIALVSSDTKLGGTTNYDALDVTDGYSVDGTTVIDGDGNVDASITSDTGTFSTSLAVGSNGTTFNQYRCDTATWDPDSVSSSTAPATLDISNTGASLGDPVIASFDSATSTSQWMVYGKVTGSGTSTISLEGVSGAAVDLSTSTAKVCTFQ